MSEINPFAPLSDGPDTSEARPLKNAPAETPVETTSEETPSTITVPDGSIKEILDWAGDDAEKAQAALDAEERTGSPRKTLVKELKEILTK